MMVCKSIKLAARHASVDAPGSIHAETHLAGRPRLIVGHAQRQVRTFSSLSLEGHFEIPQRHEGSAVADPIDLILKSLGKEHFASHPRLQM